MYRGKLYYDTREQENMTASPSESWKTLSGEISFYYLHPDFPWAITTEQKYVEILIAEQYRLLEESTIKPISKVKLAKTTLRIKSLSEPW